AHVAGAAAQQAQALHRGSPVGERVRVGISGGRELAGGAAGGYAPWLSMPVPKQSRQVAASPWSSLIRPVPPQVQQEWCGITGVHLPSVSASRLVLPSD